MVIREKLNVHPGDSSADEVEAGTASIRTVQPFDLAWHRALTPTGRRTRSYPVLLPAETRAFVSSQVGRGGYSSVSDYIRELIRADEQRKSALHS